MMYSTLKTNKLVSTLYSEVKKPPREPDLYKEFKNESYKIMSEF